MIAEPGAALQLRAAIGARGPLEGGAAVQAEITRGRLMAAGTLGLVLCRSHVRATRSPQMSVTYESGCRIKNQ